MSNTTRRGFLKTAGQCALAGAISHSFMAAHLPGVFAAPRTPGRKIKVGQIGVGHAHASKLSVFRQSSEYEVVGIVEPDPELRRKAESQAVYQGLPWMTQEQLLNAPGLELVLVETRVRPTDVPEGTGR